MSIRLSVLYLLVAGLSVYAWKDWFKSLCGLVLLMAVMEHGDMPKNILGIQGLNPWNVLFAVIFLAWAANRGREGLAWDMPRGIAVLLLMYLGIVLIGVGRAALDRTYIEDYPIKNLISDELINTVKWVLPGLLLFDGCRTRHRMIMAVVCLLVMYLVLSVQVILRLPLEAALSAGEAVTRSRAKLDQNVGYNACDLSAMLAGVSWAVVAALPLIRRKSYWIAALAAAGMATFAQALTGGRAGYVAWGTTGLVLSLLRWRKYLILAPIAVLLLSVALPGAVDRLLTGFGQTNVAGQTAIDEDALTSGRIALWYIVADKIGESPLFGYGRLAMRRTGLYDYTAIVLNEAFPHPHNMYLETLIDNGVVGSLPIFLFWATLLVYSARLFRSPNRLYSAVGGMALALILAQLVAGIGAQHFYPLESTVGMWAAMFLMLRVHVEEKRMEAGEADVEDSLNSSALAKQPVKVSAQL